MTPLQGLEWAELFLREHGVSLAAFGSDEPGVHRDVALEVIAALDAAGITPLGIEVWRNQDNGFEYDSDVNADWHCSNLRPHRNSIDARFFAIIGTGFERCGDCASWRVAISDASERLGLNAADPQPRVI